MFGLLGQLRTSHYPGLPFCGCKMHFYLDVGCVVVADSRNFPISSDFS